MIEIVFLVIFNRLVNWGLAPIIATRTVAADGDVLRSFLSNPADQWSLTSGGVDVVALRPAGDRCDAVLRLPLGARVRASLRVRARTARVLTTEVGLRRRTVATATWILTPDRGTTEVDLAVQFESRGLATRLGLLLGGRRCIARRLDATLATLATTSARVAEHFVAATAANVAPTPQAPGTQQSPVEVAHAAIHR